MIMKKPKTEKLFRQMLYFIGALSIIAFLPSCEDDDPEPVPEDPVASFQFEVSEDNWQMVTFTNFSQNATSYSWDFGDGNSSTEENPTHEYEEAGEYEVTLTASNEVGATSTFSENIEIEDPFEALRRIAGDDEKTWRLWRGEGTSLGVGPNPDDARIWWSLSNDGSTPCRYFHDFTFHLDGTFEFDDNGVFFGDAVLFGDTDFADVCFEALPENMVSADGDDLSPLLGGTHEYEYDPGSHTITLHGLGAWMGLPHLTTTEESSTLVEQKSFQVRVEEHDGYDLMHVSYTYEELYWDFTYAHYHDPSLEPEVVEEPEEVEPLDPITPDELFITFAARDEDNMALLDTVDSGSTVEFGVENPLDDTAAPVGKFIRTGGVQWQELQMRTSPELYNIQFDNFEVAKIDIYVPDDTEFNGLQRHIVFGFADMHGTEEWWNDPVQFLMEDDEVVLGEWHTYEFDLTDVKEREDLDMIYLGIGGGGHEEEGIFYIRNLIFE